MKKNISLVDRRTKIKEAGQRMKEFITAKIQDGDGFMVMANVLKDGRVHHYYDYENFPDRDWPICAGAMAENGKRVSMESTGASKV